MGYGHMQQAYTITGWQHAGSSDMEDNPFCMLFPSNEDVRQAAEVALGHKIYVSDVLTRTFLFTAAYGINRSANDM